MCGRFSQRLPWRQIHGLYQLPPHVPALNLRARYNGCPTQEFASLRLDGSGRSIKRVNSPRNDDPDLLRPLEAEAGR